MPESKVRTIRPLSLTADIVIRPGAPLDDECAAELREAVGYIVDRAGGAIVIDCADLTTVSERGASALRWFGDRADAEGRVARLRHVGPELEQELERLGLQTRFERAERTPA